MKMVFGNAVFIREEAKLARDTHRYTYIFNAKLHCQLHRWLKVICSRDYDVTLGGVTH